MIRERKKRIGAQPSTSSSSGSEDSESMPRKSVAQVIANREAKASKHVCKTGKSATPPRKKRKVVSSESIVDTEKKTPSPQTKKKISSPQVENLVIIDTPLAITLMWRVKRVKVEEDLLPKHFERN